MPLPETIPVRYTDEEAGYVTVRPVVRQIFRLDELLDMILSVTGKETGRVQQILRSGTVVYHFFRYWWTGFEANESELDEVLARFPSDDAARRFSKELCALVVFESGVTNSKPLLELPRAAASERRMFRSESFWDGLLEVAARENPRYVNYSYAHKADVYRLDVNAEIKGRITLAADKLAARKLRPGMGSLDTATRLLFYCPRS